MSKSGMRYQKTLQLVKKMEEKRDKIAGIMRRLEEDRSSEVASVYGGEAAENFKTNMKNIATDLDEKIKKIITQLNEEAEIQHDNYKKQEEALKSTPTVEVK